LLETAVQFGQFPVGIVESGETVARCHGARLQFLFQALASGIDCRDARFDVFDFLFRSGHFPVWGWVA